MIVDIKFKKANKRQPRYFYIPNWRFYLILGAGQNLPCRSIVHECSTVGLAWYSSYAGNTAKAVKSLKSGGYIGMGFAFAGIMKDLVNASVKGR